MTKPLSEFHRSRSTRDGVFAICKVCAILASKTWRAKNRELDRERRRAHYRQNADRLKRAAVEYRKKNPEKIRAANKKWRDRNPERSRMNSKEWYAKNKVRALEYSRQWNQENRERARLSARRRYHKRLEQFRAKAKEWRLKNSDKVKTYARTWRKNNVEIATFNVRRQQAKERGISYELDRDEYLRWLGTQRRVCTYCETPEALNVKVFGKRLELDRIDNAKGYRIDNICLACHICNSTKGAWLSHLDMKRLGKESVAKTWLELEKKTAA